MTPNIEQQLLSEFVRHLDLSDYCMVTPSTTVAETVERMRETKKRTAFVVGDHTVLQGLLTDRDVLRKVAAKPETWNMPITDVMTPEPQTLALSATAGDALRMMDEWGFRNVPVVNEKGVPVGNVTYFSLMNYLSDQFQEVVHNAPPTHNYANKRAGG
jgi:CBS domain-containing protein